MASPRKSDEMFPRRDHDHRRCLARSLEAADGLCARAGVHLTELRRRVLALVWRSHKPVGAYELLDALRRERPGAAPPTVYRALDFLLDHGLIHRIESLNAFVGCSAPGGPHVSQFLICRDCGTAVELSDERIDRAIRESAGEKGFAVGRRTIEIEGLCPHCR